MIRKVLIWSIVIIVLSVAYNKLIIVQPPIISSDAIKIFFLILGGIILLILFILTILGTDSQSEVIRKKQQDLLNYHKKNKITEGDYVKAGKYIGGHPDIDNEIENVLLYKLEDKLIISTKLTQYDIPKKIASIPIDSIQSINAEDASTFERRLSVGRILLVGIFALAWKKKKKNEISFLTIDWRGGRFDNSTSFVFDGVNSGQQANTCRNKIIKAIG